MKEDKITWYSNRDVDTEREIIGLERNEITGYSNSSKTVRRTLNLKYFEKIIPNIQHFEGLCVLEVDNFVQVSNNYFL